MIENFKNKAVIIGVGCSNFGENFNQSYDDMVWIAINEACEDAGISFSDIQAGYIGTFDPDKGGFGGNAGVALSNVIGTSKIPFTRVENLCATGMDAFRNACIAVASGIYDLVIAVGAEKMRDIGSRSLVTLAMETGHPYLGKGTTDPGRFAFLAQRYLYEYNIDRSYLAKVAVKNHYNGARNPKAHFKTEITLERALNAPMVAEPLGLFDCCPTTDGAAAIIVTRPELAKDFKSVPIWVKGIGLVTNRPESLKFFDQHFDLLGFDATRLAAQSAYLQAGITNPREEIDFAEVHDCFTITEIINYEDLGFCNKGEGWKFIDEGKSFLDGELPVNPSGGLKCCGHPVGATGARMIYEVVIQLRGQAGKHQVTNPEVGLAHDLGGPGSMSCVTILANLK